MQRKLRLEKLEPLRKVSLEVTASSSPELYGRGTLGEIMSISES